MKHLLALLLLPILCSLPLLSQDQSNPSGVFFTKAGSMQTIDLRLNRIIEQYAANLPIPRLALFNIAYPKDEQENLELQGFCVLEVVVCTQLEAELPISALRYSDGQQSLTIKYSWALRNDNTNPELIKGIGKFRGQYYFLIPYGLFHQDGQLSFDFKINRSNYKLVNLPIPDQCNYIPLPIPQSIAPELETKIKAFMVREFELEYSQP